MTLSRVAHNVGGGDVLDRAHEHRDASRRERRLEGCGTADRTALRHESHVRGLSQDVQLAARREHSLSLG